MAKISIITPIYHGIKFIPNLYAMIMANAKKVYSFASVEWIISNDDPEHWIDESRIGYKENLKIIQTEKNYGIHGARVRGLENASGEYVLFLDQDDRIDENWIESQLGCIGNADAVVCDCEYDGKPFYDGYDRPSLERCITREYNIYRKNGFVPGQVLIRKSSIPELWTKRIMKNNCCDDQLLWAMMYANDCSFISNIKTKYYHTLSLKNQSLNLPDRYKSSYELIEIIKNDKILHGDELKGYIASREQETIKYLGQNSVQKRKIQILKQMLGAYENKKNFSKKLAIGKDIGIYGADLGEHLAIMLTNQGYKVECIIDRLAGQIKSDYLMVKRENIPPNTTLIINTVLSDEGTVLDYLYDKYPQMEVVGVEDLLD